MNPRTCAVTRQEKSPKVMIRFVLDPDQRVVPDIRQKLPGRGVWVSLGKTILEEGIEKGHLQRAFKQPVSIDSELADLVEELLKNECLALLALARKAGQAVIGFAKVEGAIRSGKVSVIVHSREAASDGKAKIAQAIRVSGEGSIDVVEEFEGEELDSVTGFANTTHVALLPGGLAARFAEAAGRLMQYRTNGLQNRTK